MMSSDAPRRRNAGVAAVPALAGLVALSVGVGLARSSVPRQRLADGPANAPQPTPHRSGNARAGQAVFRFETFGNEGFWTDAARLPQGMAAAKVTPLAALKAGVQIDADALDGSTRQELTRELKTDRSPGNAPMLNDPKATVALVNANAVIGMVPKDTNGDGKLDVGSGDKVGVACALCHTITDGSLLNAPGHGSIGRRLDGRTNHGLNVGLLLSLAANSRAFYPVLQLQRGGKTIGRAPKGLTATASEAQVDAYLRNPRYYPVGTFDDTPDGNGNSVQITPFFRTRLAGPWGSSGQNAVLDDFNNTVYTVLFDQTTLATPQGLQFLKTLAGPAGVQLHNDYVKVLRATGVTGYPFVRAATGLKVGAASSPVGRRVDNQKLLDLNAYTDSLPAPPGARVDQAAFSRGRERFRAACTRCHNVDQSKPVPALLVPMRTIFPGYAPTVIMKRKPPLSPVQNSPGTFDDRMIVVDASPAGLKRGNALPLLLDLERKPRFLHDSSVPGLNALLDPARGARAPHPFYLANRAARADMIAFLRGLDTRH